MKKLTKTKLVAVSILTSSLLFTGCFDDKSEAKEIKKVTEVKVETKKIETKKVVTYNRYDSVEQEVFKDVAKIGPNGKAMILVFGTNTDPYSDRLKADITNSKELSSKLKNDFSSYYLKAHKNLRHKLFHEGKFMDVDTKTMISIYAITSTPTLIFTDTNAKAVIVVPGYMPTEQFLVTLDFMSQGKWKGKNRKNGEVYEALRTFYSNNGIDVKKAKDK